MSNTKTSEKIKDQIVVPILNDEYKVIVCWGNEVQIKNALKQWHYPDEELLQQHMLINRGLCFHHPSCHPLIALPKRPKTAQEIGTLAHEAVHAVEAILNKIEQPLGGEILAHSVGAIVRNTLKESL